MSFRRLFVAAFAALAVLAALPVAQAQSWPTKPVKFVVPFPPGGGNDALAREMANELTKKLGQPFVVENKPGASGNIGIDAVAKSPPDGYTILVVSSTLVTNPGLAAVPYDAIKDFAPVTMAATLPVALIVSDNVPAKNVQELIAYAKANPGKLTYGSAGIGAPHHLTTEYFNSQVGISMLHVPFKGQGQIVPELLAGRVDVAFLAISSVVQHLKTGKVRGLAVTGAQRTSIAPELPTMAEAGFPGIVIEWWLAVLAPAGTPPDIVTKLNAEIVALARNPEFKAKLAGQGIEMIGSPPEALTAAIREEIPRWTAVVKSANIKSQ